MPQGLPRRRHSLRGERDFLLHGGVAHVAQMAHRRREVVRPDEDRVDAVDGGDRFEPGEAASVSIWTITQISLARALQVVGHRAEAAAAMRAGDAAHARRRIARGRDRALRLVLVLHERQQQRLRAGIEQRA